MICPQCGNQLPRNPKYCSRCGLDFEYVKRYEPELLKKMGWQEENTEASFQVSFTSSMGRHREEPAPEQVREMWREPDFPVQPTPVEWKTADSTLSDGPEPPKPRRPRKKWLKPLVSIAACVAVVVLVVIFVTLNNGNTKQPGQTEPVIVNPVQARNLARVESTVGENEFIFRTEFSPLGQPVAVYYESGSGDRVFCRLEWDEKGRMTGEFYYDYDREEAVESYRYTYNELDEVVRVEIFDAAENINSANEMEYEDGNVTVRRLYDENGDLIEVYQATYENGRLVREHYSDPGNSFSSTYTYAYLADEGDALEWMTYEDTDGTGDYKVLFEYDSRGNCTDEVYLAAGGEQFKCMEYEYDNQNRLIYQCEYDADLNKMEWYSFDYDSSGNMTGQHHESGTVSESWIYKYDAQGILQENRYYKRYLEFDSATGENAEEVHVYFYQDMEVPEAIVKNLLAGIELSDMNNTYVNILE